MPDDRARVVQSMFSVIKKALTPDEAFYLCVIIYGQIEGGFVEAGLEEGYTLLELRDMQARAFEDAVKSYRAHMARARQ